MTTIMQSIFKAFILTIFLTTGFKTTAQPEWSAQNNRWNINGNTSITWKIDSQIPHDDHIEMSGTKISSVIRYGVDAKGQFHHTRSLVWPMLRTIPNNTHASLTRRFAWEVLQNILFDKTCIRTERVNEITLNGIIRVKSRIKINDNPDIANINQYPIELTRELFPSVDQPVYCERYTFTNRQNSAIGIEIPEAQMAYQTEKEQGVDGSYTIVSKINHPKENIHLQPNESFSLDVIFYALKPGENIPIIDVSVEKEKREALVRQLANNLVLETPDTILNTAFSFAKIRAAESIYDTKGGLMHGPGGEAYYAAIWANDQAEYINPFFPFLGYETGNKSALNSFRHFARYMNPEYNAIPSSIIAEGTDIWNGAGDRGDAAMIAYGASRYALAKGSKEEAETLWPLITWCLEYNKRKLNSEGVVSSKTDELEGRFPAGDANLCTSSLYYDALISTVALGKELKKPEKQLDAYKKEAQALHTAIEKYFGSTINGYETYQYYKGNTTLRSWICIPLTVGIYDRKEGTINALFSKELWTPEGLLTEAGVSTFWDRTTLYALHGVFAAGETAKAMHFLSYYSNKRLLGEHVPYPVGAYPEGNQRHLSAESGLYCRIITEGLFGIRPTGLHSFDITPRLPENWNEMKLKNIHAFDQLFDIEIRRETKGLEILIYKDGKVIQKKKAKVDQTVRIAF